MKSSIDPTSALVQSSTYDQGLYHGLPEHSKPVRLRMEGQLGIVHSIRADLKDAAVQGTVLLDAAFKPKAVWQFEAVMVLLSGFWPARGLLSGDWPPLGDSDGDDTPAEAGIAKNSPVGSFDQGRTMRSRSLRAKQR